MRIKDLVNAEELRFTEVFHTKNNDLAIEKGKK
jgi:hypothetical protein